MWHKLKVLYHKKTLVFYVVLAILIPSQSFAQKPAPPCALGHEGGFGPYDYYNPASAGALANVTGAHFHSGVRAMERGAAGDLDYTLRAIPNHPMALDVVSRLDFEIRAGRKPGNKKLTRTVDCYFARAIHFSPKIGVTYYLYGLHFHRGNEYEDAVEQYAKAEEFGMRSAEFHYNYGLLLADMGELDGAMIRAKKAYGSGFPLPGLKARLEKAGAWDDAALARKAE